MMVELLLEMDGMMIVMLMLLMTGHDDAICAAAVGDEDFAAC